MASPLAPPVIITPTNLANLRLLSWWQHTNLPESSDASLLTSTLLVWLLRNAWQLDAEPTSLFEYCDKLQEALRASGVTNDWDVVHELKSSVSPRRLETAQSAIVLCGECKIVHLQSLC